MEEHLLVIKEALEDYTNNFATKEESEKIDSKWLEIEQALRTKSLVNNKAIIYFALMAYIEDSISSELNRINEIDLAWKNISNKIS